MIKLIYKIHKKGITNLTKNILEYTYYKLFKLQSKFEFQGKAYNYFYHRYNNTWKNERRVEVPIVMEFIKNYKDKRILEIGAVLPHYFRIKHDVLDKFERGKDIINKDMVDFKPEYKYDLIVSISTLEHVGFDDTIKDAKQVIKAIKNLRRNCLNIRGVAVITFPIGYNKDLDKFLFTRKIEFDSIAFMKKINKNKWKETQMKEILSSKYGIPFPYANAIAIATIIKS